MSDEAQDPAKPNRPRKAAKKPGAPVRTRTKAKDAATSETVVSPRTSSVPEVPVTARNATSQRASAWRLGLLTTTLAVLIGGLAWFSDSSELTGSDSTQIAYGLPFASARSDATDAVSETRAPTQAVAQLQHQPQHRSLEEELRIATLALDLRESRESLMRLQDETRALASNVGLLAGGIEALKSDMEAVRADTASGFARVEDRVATVEVAVSPAAIPLGDPALRQVELLGDPSFHIAEANTGQPTTTGGLPDVQPSPEASVKVSFAKPKQRAKAARPINGWSVHSVRDDLALVEGNGIHYEVREGELLPDAGIVRAIRKRGEKWVVLTNKGMITEPN